MIRPPRSDFWNVGIVPASIQALAEPGTLEACRDQIVWLPDPGEWRYLADPFGLKRDGTTHIFVEAFDYRTKHAVIEHHAFDRKLTWQEKSIVLSGPFHLSYPYLIQHAGEVFMIPECHRSNEVTLYHAAEFPGKWVREATLLSDISAAEASVIKHEGLWWMFYTVVGPEAADQKELHIAHAPNLHGPWTRHPKNPLIRNLSGARPGGTPFIDNDGFVVLPVQDCSVTYGGAARFLKFTQLSVSQITVTHLRTRLTGDLASSTHHDGLHTVSSCGDLTLIDTKRIARLWSRHAINFQRNFNKLGLGATQPHLQVV
ncbi:glucosamine inositolphosphorylceramide transferase family protein [Oleiharenicola lentus]|uniref:glucosamine inositolphosphorylceramide transferase family protein n=1 Tax=Oleiharenicola lentus TaxID=2508720 RepID=UPI003F67A998